jgi:hypothetical protein
MSTKPDGWPAFPADGLKLNDGMPNPGMWPGMTLLDWFAGQALSGIIASHSAEGINLPSRTKACEWAFDYAHGMLDERNKP